MPQNLKTLSAFAITHILKKKYLVIIQHLSSSEMESKILLTIQFNLTFTSPLKFLERQITGANLCDKINYASKMILELSLLDIRCLKYSYLIYIQIFILLISYHCHTISYQPTSISTSITLLITLCR